MKRGLQIPVRLTVTTSERRGQHRRLAQSAPQTLHEQQFDS
jgi:hypothetical protein